ncbi:Pyridine nucleotide-disulfide oxidoreductase, FAD/NAD(P)-binding domain protein (plasmid) [Gemmatirosa kalamazoonensis]|uniref:Pyridine nucleotide-disulfide oxidoreductase, FAD/NAD(P)-binding domain protein n=1 Tax=Gemmatirosa kalamazoonensis TaxID=861299 RepID=W0RPZ9_9BACT|nr:FAD/NAD(P)-binding oxidoreductase [Gemmatirosa kalamazoonensis]AHG92415.1 Pyridine nucleotide-disulfide oxidoreductase, FAD/NAD(P)-binding domain protein [Gemmatirosa kalamazoonensis]
MHGLGARDVVVVGGGPAGIAAATRAAESGARVVLVDESPLPGGQIWRHRTDAPAAARPWLERLRRSGATLMASSAVIDAWAEPSDDGELLALAVERIAAGDGASAGAPSVVRTHAVVLATGARERFLPFPGWTLPGVVGVGGAQALLKGGTSFAGRRVVIAGSGPLLLPVAAALSGAGARVALVAEQAPLGRVAAFAAGLWRRPRALVEAARYRAGFRRTPYRVGEWVAAAHAGANGALAAVEVTDGTRVRTLDCDLLCAGYGLVPNTELARLLGCRTQAGAVVVDARQATTRAGVFCAGEPTGIGGVDLALVEGEIAGLCAAGRDDGAAALHGRREGLRALAAAMDRAFAPRAELLALARPDTIVCRCEDVPLGAIEPGWSARQAKLQTRAGMGPCQGRVCGAALELLRGWPADADSVRPPIAPASLGTLRRVQ